MSARFVVKRGGVAGVRSDAFSLRVLSMLNFGLNTVVEDAAALILDYRDGGFSTGTASGWRLRRSFPFLSCRR